MKGGRVGYPIRKCERTSALRMETKQEAIYTIPEVAELLKVHKDTVQRWIEEEQLGCVRIGRRTTRVLQSDIDKFIIDKRAEGNHLTD